MPNLSATLHHSLGSAVVQTLSEDLKLTISHRGKKNAQTVARPFLGKAHAVIEGKTAGRLHTGAVWAELAQVHGIPTAYFQE
jgi:hypothetical protein